MNFFQRYITRQAEKIEPPAAKPPPLPAEARTTDTFEPIHIDDAQYVLLTRALRSGSARVLKDLQVDAPESNVPTAVVGEASQPIPSNPRVVPPDQPPGTPIV